MTHNSHPDWLRRLDAVRLQIAARSLQAIVISGPANRRYLTGFTGSSAWLLVSPAEAVLLTDGRYEAAVRRGLSEGSLGPVSLELVPGRYETALAGLLGRLGFRTVGFEAAHTTVAMLRHWQHATPDITWTPTEDIVEDLRLIKDAHELAVLRRAAGLLSEVAGAVTEFARPGRTERAVAADIDGALLRSGFERTAFDTIVASGPNSAYPHARPTDRRLAKGDLVVLDFGGVLDGYCVDLTRVVGIGQVDSARQSLFDAVAVAQAAAIATVRAGGTTADVDRAARTSLESRGLGLAFSHGTGHGLGLEVHEAPRVTRDHAGSTTTLQPGMVFTIEPGAYLEDLGGVRLEDDVLVTPDGCEVLTSAPRGLVIV